ncbi:TRAP transporter substrate-binding protein DctP [Paracoccus sp. J55]|uniref:TRAP transporter substrate-binding protein DctP n=1 Tax=Paracoccus sp. J55 TaxID=935849 RepID=UPI00049109AC|nr:TRAP transporter substrate-binding protein DctP [Paracoccus sp. J55]
MGPDLKLATLAVVIAMGTGGAAQAELVLSYSMWHPPGYVVNEAVLPFLDEIAEVTEGRVRVENRAAAVGTPRDQHEVVAEGLVDVSLVVPGYTPNRFPLMEISELPMLSDDASKLAPAINEVFEKYLRDLNGYGDVHVISAFSVAPAQIMTRNRELKTLGDIRGQKYYMSNRPVTAAMTKLGAAPVTASIADTYSMASNGVIDGMVMPYEPTLTWKLDDYFTNTTTIPGALGQAGMALIVNRDKWDQISPEDQAAIMAIGGRNLAQKVGDAVQAGEIRSREAMVGKGMVIKEMGAEALDALTKEVHETIYPAWIAQAEKAGLTNAADILAELQAAVAK